MLLMNFMRKDFLVEEHDLYQKKGFDLSKKVN